MVAYVAAFPAQASEAVAPPQRGCEATVALGMAAQSEHSTHRLVLADSAIRTEGLTQSYGTHRGVFDLDLDVGEG